jgi:hypothetical protein
MAEKGRRLGARCNVKLQESQSALDSHAREADRS